ncbi:hypothetical protein C6A85_09260, partial [Mycobacterium sp. ITM-2017-0098]
AGAAAALERLADELAPGTTADVAAAVRPDLPTGALTAFAVAAPGKSVLSLQADGSAMYTVCALWTQARENLDVTTVIFDN